MDVPLYKIFSNIKCQYIKYLCISVYGVLLVIIKLQINSVKSVQHFKFDFFALVQRRQNFEHSKSEELREFCGFV